MYNTKIQGTKYIVALDSVGGQWFLRLKLDQIVEAEEEVEQLTKKEINQALDKLFSAVSLQINNFQHELILDQLVTQISHLILQDQIKRNEVKRSEQVVKEDPRVDLLLEKIEKLEKIVATLEDRIERMEYLSK